MTWFDTHAHYDDATFDEDRDTLLSSLPGYGITHLIDPGCDLLSSEKALAIARQYPFCYAAVGIHPENCGDFSDAQIEAVRQLAQEEKVVAIGEIGLDYHWDNNPPHELQKEVFRHQLALSVSLDLPVIVHDRDAHEDSLTIIREFPKAYGVFHCFSGSVEMARQLLDLGWYLGFDGPLTYKNARKAVEVAAFAPADRLLLETDAPYLTPVPYRGQRNDSRLLPHIAQRMAEIRGVSIEQIAIQTEENAIRLFRI